MNGKAYWNFTEFKILTLLQIIRLCLRVSPMGVRGQVFLFLELFLHFISSFFFWMVSATPGSAKPNIHLCSAQLFPKLRVFHFSLSLPLEEASDFRLKASSFLPVSYPPNGMLGNTHAITPRKFPSTQKSCFFWQEIMPSCSCKAFLLFVIYNRM